MTWAEAVVEARELGVTIRGLPAWAPMVGITVGRYVFVKGEDALTLRHELVHVRQQRAHPVWFWLSYLVLPLPLFWSWRYRWEAEAYRVELDAGCRAEDLARAMSSSLYGWPCRYRTALRELLRSK